MRYNLKKQLRSFVYAWHGLKAVVGKEQNLDFDLVVGAVVVVCGWLLGLSRMEWIAVLICIGMVLFAEMMNTAIEKLVDLVSPEWNALAGKVKDIAAAAVMVLAFAAAVVGLIIFVPHIISLFG